jgi:hypothetical protein
MWDMKCFVITVIIGATGIISKSLQKYVRTTLNRFPTKTATLGTSHIIRKVLQAESCSLSGGVHHWPKRRSTREERKPVTRERNNNNKPEIVKIKKDRTCLLFDVAMPSDTNVIQKEASTEIQRM